MTTVTIREPNGHEWRVSNVTIVDYQPGSVLVHWTVGGKPVPPRETPITADMTVTIATT